VYAIARAIPPGATRTYGDIAAELGDLTASRAVGQALGRNPVPIVVPCHRVLAAGGRLRGSRPRRDRHELRLLDIERVHARGAPDAVLIAVGQRPTARRNSSRQITAMATARKRDVQPMTPTTASTKVTAATAPAVPAREHQAIGAPLNGRCGAGPPAAVRSLMRTRMTCLAARAESCKRSLRPGIP